MQHGPFYEFAVAAFLSLATAVSAAPLNLVRVTVGLSKPVYVTAAPGDNDHLYVVEQHSGQIRVMDRTTGVISASPFHTIGNITKGGEQGLLGLAFDPNYATNGHFYVNYTDSNGDTQIERYSRSAGNPLQADATSAHKIMSIDQPASNHNGGWLGFSPNNGYLYIASGDGGGGNDPNNHAQTITNDKLGKMLRVDVHGDDFVGDDSRNYALPPTNPFVGGAGDDEIWAFGLRNPWRASFDRSTGDLYIGDVGQGAREEINFQAANAIGGANYGWRLREGLIQTPGIGGPTPPGAIDPIYDYPRSDGQAVTGGYVYRGPDPALRGEYFFADFVSDNLWSLKRDGNGVWQVTDWTNELVLTNLDGLPLGINTLGNISSFGEDIFGELYIVDYDGEIFRVAPVPLPAGIALLASATGFLLTRRRVESVSIIRG